MKMKKTVAVLLIAVLALCLCACGKAAYFISGIGLGVSEEATAKAMNYYLAMAAIDKDHSDEYMEQFNENKDTIYFGVLDKKYPGKVVYGFSNEKVTNMMTFTHTGDDLQECYECAWDYFTKELGPAVSGSKSEGNAAWFKDGINVSAQLGEENVVIVVDNINAE